jgi:CRP-like cAMP-binding protein
MIQANGLRSLSSLDPFSDKDLDLLLAVSRARSIASGSVLYAQGERARSCFLLVQGLVQVERARASGAQVIATLHPGTFVGQIALIDNGKRTATVRAATDCEGLELSAEIVDQLMTGCAPLSLAFQDQLAIAGIRQFRQAMALIAAIPPPRRSDAQRTRELDQVQAYLTDSGVSLDVLDAIEVVHDGAGPRGRHG